MPAPHEETRDDLGNSMRDGYDCPSLVNPETPRKIPVASGQTPKSSVNMISMRRSQFNWSWVTPIISILTTQHLVRKCENEDIGNSTLQREEKRIGSELHNR